MKPIVTAYSRILAAFKENKLKFFLVLACYLSCAALIITMPLFTYREGLNNLTIILALVFGAFLLVYIVLFDKIRLDVYVISFIVYLVVSFLSTLLGSENLSAWRTVLTTVLLGISLFQFVVSRKSYKFVPMCFVFASLLLCGSVFLEYHSYIFSFDFDRLGALFGDVNDVGLMIATGGLFALYLSFAYKPLIAKVSLWLLYVVFAAFIFLTGSRGALLVFGFGFVVFLYQMLWKNHKILFLMLVLVFVSLAIGLLYMPFMSDLRERIFGILGSILSHGTIGDSSASKRLNMMFEAFEIWAKNPVLGHGCASFAVLSNQSTFSHSTISELLCSYGIIGAFFWIAPMVYYVTRGNAKAKTIARMFFFGFMFPASFSFVLIQSKFPMAVYGVVSGMCFAMTADFPKVCIGFDLQYILNVEVRLNSLGNFDWHARNKGVIKEEK